jgi:hypothetical protein
MFAMPMMLALGGGGCAIEVAATPQTSAEIPIHGIFMVDDYTSNAYRFDARIVFVGNQGNKSFPARRQLEALPHLIMSEALIHVGGSSGSREKRRYVPLDQL